MISDEERREVADKLREQLSYMRKSAGYEEDADMVECGNSAYRNIAWSVEPYGNAEKGNYVHIVERLADLIEPQERTCTNESASSKYFTCSECGAELMQITPGWVALVNGRVNYCPNCGARITGGTGITEVDDA